MPDIDIDCKDRKEVLKVLSHIPASIIRAGEIEKHNTGVYFHTVPVDPLTGLCSLDHKEAGKRGYFKVDLLNVHVYEGVEDEAHLDRLLEREPMWEMLESWDIVQNLFQLGNPKTFEVLQKMKPQSIDQLAMIIAIIRPPKRHLIGKDWATVEGEIWDITEEEKHKGAFRKSHAYAYAHALKVQMNRMVEEAEQAV
jgi:hypothetical protein